MTSENSTIHATIIDEICELCFQSSKNMSWLIEPLTPGRARAYLLQHILRNRLLSAVIRPAWVNRCPDLAVVRKTIGQMREELVYDDVIQHPHTDILWEMGRNIGLTDAEMNSSKPVPPVEVAFNILENTARTQHWICGWMSSSVGEFLLADLPSHNLRGAVWKESLGLTDAQVFFLRITKNQTRITQAVTCGVPSRGMCSTTRVGRRCSRARDWRCRRCSSSIEALPIWATNWTLNQAADNA